MCEADWLLYSLYNKLFCLSLNLYSMLYCVFSDVFETSSRTIRSVQHYYHVKALNICLCI